MGTFLFIVFIVLLVYIFSRSRKNNNEINSGRISTTDHRIDHTNNTYKNDISNFLAERNITTLFHFTRLSNLNSIMEHGLYPRNKINSIYQNVIINDQYRIDKRINTSSLSISFPNSKMFYKYRMLQKDTQWIVLGLDVAILYEKNCLFCFTNAASKAITSLSNEDLKGIEALKKLFIRHNDIEYDLPVNFPTDIQAEVLVQDIIEPKYIKFIHTDDKLIADEGIKFDKTYFDSRDYYLKNH